MSAIISISPSLCQVCGGGENIFSYHSEIQGNEDLAITQGKCTVSSIDYKCNFDEVERDGWTCILE